MKKAAFILGLALALALLISAVSRPMPVEERLISIQARELMPGFDAIGEQPVEVQAAIVDLGDDPLLVLKAQAAMLAYPEMARTILPLYAAEPEFREVLRRYGEHALPPIDYFLGESVSSLEWMNKVNRQYQRARSFLADLGGEEGSDQSGAKSEAQPEQRLTGASLTPEERGWYAVNFIKEEGHDFLGQFVVDAQGDTQWIQTERVLEGITRFFTSGVRQLETNYRTGEVITLSDIGWASVDVLVFTSAVKLLRAGRGAATATRGANLSTRSAALAARITAGGRLILSSTRYAKWPVIIGAGYLVLRHPGIISDVFAGIAEVVGVPPLAIQVVGWLLILAPILYLTSWLLIPAVVVLRGLLGGVLQLAGRGARSRSDF
ncbi:MAG: PspC domain-containing protein [Pseudomonadota bacterium]